MLACASARLADDGRRCGPPAEADRSQHSSTAIVNGPAPKQALCSESMQIYCSEAHICQVCIVCTCQVASQCKCQSQAPRPCQQSLCCTSHWTGAAGPGVNLNRQLLGPPARWNQPSTYISFCSIRANVSCPTVHATWVHAAAFSACSVCMLLVGPNAIEQPTEPSKN